MIKNECIEGSQPTCAWIAHNLFIGPLLMGSLFFLEFALFPCVWWGCLQVGPKNTYPVLFFTKRPSTLGGMYGYCYLTPNGQISQKFLATDSQL
jgi:hypothetical protein